MRCVVLGLLLPLACYAGADPSSSSAGTDEGTSQPSSDDDGSSSPSTSASGTGPGSATSSPSTSDSSPTSSTSADATSEPTTSDPSATDDGSSDADTGAPQPGEPTADEAELLELIDAYRAMNGLPSIPTSTSMMIVAQTHAEDLALNNPDVGECNLHSWSDAGPWTPCCYTPDHAEAQCMWDKPRELTDYPGDGYEISAAGTATAASALAAWQSSPPHNDVILNAGIWADNPWGAIGAGMHSGYAVVWFGVESD